MERKMRILRTLDVDQLIKGANELMIKQEDIVHIFIKDDEYILIYFG